jgi:hypothetical protein
MNISANSKLILASTRDLSNRWQETLAQWHDSKSHEFEQEYLSVLFSEAERAAQAMEEINKVLLSIRSQCE